MKHKPHVSAKAEKVDEIPFDFNRKLPSRFIPAQRSRATRASSCRVTAMALESSAVCTASRAAIVTGLRPAWRAW